MAGREELAGRMANPLLVVPDLSARAVLPEVVQFYYAQARVMDASLGPWDTLPKHKQDFWGIRVRDLLYAGHQEQRNCRWCDPAIFMFVPASGPVVVPHEFTISLAQRVVRAGRDGDAAFKGLRQVRIFLDRRSPMHFRIETMGVVKSGCTIQAGSDYGRDFGLACGGNLRKATKMALDQLAKVPR